MIINVSYLNLIMFVCVYLFCVCEQAHDKACLWRSEDNLWEFILPFYHINPQTWTQVFRCISKHHYLLSHLTVPIRPTFQCIDRSLFSSLMFFEYILNLKSSGNMFDQSNKSMCCTRKHWLKSMKTLQTLRHFPCWLAITHFS